MKKIKVIKVNKSGAITFIDKKLLNKTSRINTTRYCYLNIKTYNLEEIFE